MKDEEHNKIWKKINGLSYKQREIIILHFYHGLRIREVAKHLGIPSGTCKSRLNSALNKLRKYLALDDFEFVIKGGDVSESG
jgi:RNA polymerase sigma factor (sigma-70 family)